jgi:tetratricopeptide (TPR) repeat protein
MFTLRTAKDAFAAWSNRNDVFSCKDCALLYVVAARSLGLNAYDVDVEDESNGQESSHACAAVFLCNRLILVDPALGVFDAPYKRFYVLNDVESIGLYMSQVGAPESCEIGVKLCPRVPLVQLNYFNHLINAERTQEALEVFRTLQKLPFNEATRAYILGKIDYAQGNVDDAASLMLKAIAINPCESTYRIGLAKAYAGAGDLTNAVSALRKTLEVPLIASDRGLTLSLIAHSNDFVCWELLNRAQKLIKKGETVSSRYCCDRAIQLCPEDGEAYFMRAYVKKVAGDTNGAQNDYNTAVQLNSGKMSRPNGP